MVIIDVYPQLGNALFQIATTEALAKRMDVKCFVNHFKQKDLFNYNPIAADAVWNYYEHEFNYNEIKLLPNYGNIRLNGYFQTEKYFEDQAEYIRDIFTISNEYKFEKQDVCAIHVRRGDYLKLQEFHPVLPIEYYDDAVNLMKKRGVTDFVIFSDDPEWCKENLASRYKNTEIRDRMFTGGDWLDFSEMSSCSSHIIANSTFGWWAAWLANSELVVAPNPHKRWFGPAYSHYDMQDLIPERWNIL